MATKRRFRELLDDDCCGVCPPCSCCKPVTCCCPPCCPVPNCCPCPTPKPCCLYPPCDPKPPECPGTCPTPVACPCKGCVYPDPPPPCPTPTPPVCPIPPCGCIPYIKPRPCCCMPPCCIPEPCTPPCPPALCKPPKYCDDADDAVRQRCDDSDANASYCRSGSSTGFTGFQRNEVLRNQNGCELCYQACPQVMSPPPCRIPSTFFQSTFRDEDFEFTPARNSASQSLQSRRDLTQNYAQRKYQ
ncbi:unnamed protein product [Notodromas monacha]|uniref:Uncharacterized protein n=1 Tax=Notodromas monacha TaxID=399045 RepID=A0A7R9BNB2_9CRUS|nr:unnamed protein product [Notodromas monacha]CAD7277653.1 unnamed protein product [Notodromas monacha]CAG0917804.1 unnamed protein product [Notodromas monacha]CAG0917805.1 unnamed protein product [Notodromas monacha]